MEQDAFPKGYEPQAVEARWYDHWLRHELFHAQDESERPPFAIVIPPPNVTGMLHMGHALNNVLQDIVVRCKRMQGYNALWMPGTDHAGIATQNVVEQELAREGLSRHDLGRERFIARVWEWRERYGGVIIHQLKRLGCSCDWARERFTMDEGLSRAVREVFVRLYRDGLVYQGDYIVNWCPRCHTAISDLEVEYKEETGHLWHIRYPYVDGSGYIVVATTRPETMLGDTAVAVHPQDDRYRAAVGKKVRLPLMNREIPVVADDYVTMDFGSGAVKITPACDPNDFAMAGRQNLDIVRIMDGSAVINENGGVYQGQDRYVCRENVVRDLEQQGYLVSTEPYTHNVGRCYRCKTDVEPAVSKQWFVRIAPLAREATAAVVRGRTRIVPPLWEATYFDWMDNIRDWCISRQIWWGHRIPVWTCENCQRVIVQTDDPEACPACGSRGLQQEEDVLDTWFSSALWPFSTLGWPDDTPALRTFYPTSLLITGFDILFFWVARMMMMGLYVMKDVPFRDVYLHALVRDENGEKMSKSRGNIIDPLAMIDKYGADAFRFTLAAFSAQGRDVRMSEERIAGYKFFVNKLWNAARFCHLHVANAPGAEAESDGPSFLADRWIRSRLNAAVEAVTRGLEEYRFNDAAAAAYQFVWHEFCDWYLELAKPVLYGRGSPAGRGKTQRVLREILLDSLKLLHPFMPFVTEEIWQRFVSGDGSIMTAPFPVAREDRRCPAAEEEMGLLREIVTKIRNVRGEMAIAPSRKLRVAFSTAAPEIRNSIARETASLKNLANLEELRLAADGEEPRHAATALAGPVRLYVLLEGIIHWEAEQARLGKEIAKVEKELAQAGKKLANRDFVAKASPAVVEKEERRHRALQEKHASLAAARERLAALA